MLTAFYGMITWSLLNISALDIAYGSVRGGNSLQYDKGSSIHMKKRQDAVKNMCEACSRSISNEGGAYFCKHAVSRLISPGSKKACAKKSGCYGY